MYIHVTSSGACGDDLRFIGWANNHFNNLRFRNSLETKKRNEMGKGKSLRFSQF